MSWRPPEHDRAVELRDHLPERGWREAVAEICARHGMEGSELSPFPSGSDVVWAAGDAVVKLTAPSWRNELESEARCLAHVEDRLSVSTPSVLAVGELAGWPYVVMTRVEGVTIGSAWPRLDRDERLRLAAELGLLTRELHGLELPEGPDDWDGFWRTCRTDVARRHARAGVPGGLLWAIAPFLEEVGALESDSRALLHTELLDQHVLVDERGGRVAACGLIDFADGRVGAVEYEFAAPVEFIFKGEPGLLRTFLAAYGLPDSELGEGRSERLLAWALCHQFGSLARMLEAIAPARPRTLGALARLLYGL